MDTVLTERLATLHADFDKGNAHLIQLERQVAGLREKLLMISGAIQVLTELSAPAPDTVPAEK